MLRLIDEILANLPPEAIGAVAWLCTAAAILGLIIWLFGSRFGRSLMTLALVSIGGLTGLQMPRWFNWPLGGWATCIGLVLILGISGYVCQRFWIAVGLSLLLALWTAAALVGAYAIDILAVAEGDSLSKCAVNAWSAIPASLHLAGPLAILIAISAGLTAGILFARPAMFLFYAMLGTSLIVVFATFALRAKGFDAISPLPQDWRYRLAIASGVALVGTAVQWQLSPRRPKPSEKEAQ